MGVSFGVTMIRLFQKKHDLVRLEKVDLGSRVVEIPIARLQGGDPGPTLLITAGIDGDEYAGMEACYRLIEEFSSTSYKGTLIIVPIVNVPGFLAQTSENPMDGQFPKYIFPGKKNGTPTEQLCWWVSGLAGASDFWLDMHGGALTEILNPFIGSWVSGDKEIDRLVTGIISSVSCEHAFFEKASFISKTKLLARMGCGYLLAESGDLGAVREKDVERHIGWAREVMVALGLLEEKRNTYSKTIFQHIHEYSIRHNGVWRPRYSVCREVNRGEILGEVFSLGGAVLEKVLVKEKGMLLWGKVGQSARRADVIAGVGYC
jgi:uncharacterized protein